MYCWQPLSAAASVLFILLIKLPKPHIASLAFFRALQLSFAFSIHAHVYSSRFILFLLHLSTFPIHENFLSPETAQTTDITKQTG
jgi:hypothetical protein